MISKATIDKIFSVIRVEEVISDFVALKKSGSNFKGLSPFADEKTPSFMISPAKQIWKDFSSGKGGNAVSFLMELENYTYPEALRYLAKKYNIEIEETEIQQTQEQIDEKQKTESLYNVTEFAQKFFKQQLLETDEGKNVGLSYFKERGFSDATIAKFQLGYSPKQKNTFTEFALQQGYKKDILQQSGLSIFNDNSEGIDRFRERVMFPIFSFSGRILGFGARILRSDIKTAKYLNSPESEIYHKSKILYGLFQSKKEIIKQDNCLLVEGYTDVISLHQNGIENVVASSGTSLTEDQIRLIKRLTNNITILYDGDSAGIKASFRGIDMILTQEMNVKILLFPEGEDPDGFARNHSEEELKEFIKNNTTDFIQFKTQLLQKETENDPVAKANLTKEIVNSIALIKNLIQREIYVKETAKTLNISESTLFKEVAQTIANQQHKSEREIQNIISNEPKIIEEETIEINPLYVLEEEIMQLLLKYGDYIIELNIDDEITQTSVIEEIISQTEKDNIVFHPFYQSIYNNIKQGYEQQELRTGNFFIHYFEEENQNFKKEISEFATHLVFEKYKISENWKSKEIYVRSREKDISKRVKETMLRYKWLMLKNIIDDFYTEINDENREEQLQRIMQLIQFRHQINQELNRVV